MQTQTPDLSGQSKKQMPNLRIDIAAVCLSAQGKRHHAPKTTRSNTLLNKAVPQEMHNGCDERTFTSHFNGQQHAQLDVGSQLEGGRKSGCGPAKKQSDNVS